MQFGETLKYLRTMYDITQGELASELGVTKMAVSKWERCECEPDIEKLNKIADIFHVTLDVLCGRPQDTTSDVQVMTKAMYNMTPKERETVLNISRLMYSKAFDDVE